MGHFRMHMGLTFGKLEGSTISSCTHSTSFETRKYWETVEIEEIPHLPKSNTLCNPVSTEHIIHRREEGDGRGLN